LSLINKNEDKLLDSNIISNGRNQYAQVADRELKSALEYYKAEGGFYVATSVAFNQLTPEAQGFYDGLSKEKQKEIGDAILKLDSGQGEALVQRVINEYRIEEERLRQSPVKASVKISSRGHFGSGTIIGVDKEGRPIILTAGHLTGARTPGTKKTITFPDETTTTATVLAGQGSWGASSGNDLSIMRIDKPMKDIAYVPVALSSHNIDTKKPVLRIGYPGGNNMKKVSVAIIRFSETGRTQTRGGLNGGNSGGGMFQNGRLLGVISIDMESATGYANLNLMRKFLTDQGYGYLIKIMVVFF